jgi:hypothetical protein
MTQGKTPVYGRVGATARQYLSSRMPSPSDAATRNVLSILFVSQPHLTHPLRTLSNAYLDYPRRSRGLRRKRSIVRKRNPRCGIRAPTWSFSGYVPCGYRVHCRRANSTYLLCVCVEITLGVPRVDAQCFCSSIPTCMHFSEGRYTLA